jgi:hypothetical protein
VRLAGHDASRLNGMTRVKSYERSVQSNVQHNDAGEATRGEDHSGAVGRLSQLGPTMPFAAVRM